jgi:hypothetical protein
LSNVSANALEAAPEDALHRSARRERLTTQFVLGGVFDLQGLCSRDSCVREAILRRIPLAFINDFGRTSAAERIADGHCDQGLATGTGTGTGAAVRCGVFQRPVRAGRRG